MNETDKEDFKCPICESTHLLTTTQSKTYSYGGRKFVVIVVLNLYYQNKKRTTKTEFETLIKKNMIAPCNPMSFEKARR